MPLNEDLSVFLNPEEHGETLTFTLRDGSTEDLDGIWDAPFNQAAGMESAAPQFAVATSAAGNLHHGAQTTRGGKTYRIQHFEPDGTGITFVILEDA